MYTANPTPQYKWYKDDVELKGSLLTTSIIQIKSNGKLIFEVCNFFMLYKFMNLFRLA